MVVLMKYFRRFDDSLLERHPDLFDSLKPSDHYPELTHILKNRQLNLPVGSLNTKLIVVNGEIVERVYKTPKGKVLSLSSRLSKTDLDKAA